jgi:di- and tripeptidase
MNASLLPLSLVMSASSPARVPRTSAFSLQTTSHMKPASLSRDLRASQVAPRLLHSLQENKSSVLSLAATDEYIFSGSQNRDILVRTDPISASCDLIVPVQVWDKKTFTLKDTLRGHTGSVLALECARDREWLFSSGGRSTMIHRHTKRI